MRGQPSARSKLTRAGGGPAGIAEGAPPSATNGMRAVLMLPPGQLAAVGVSSPVPASTYVRS